MKVGPQAKVDMARARRAAEEHRPLLLLVAGQEAALMALRALLRESGYLVASSRSIAAAVSLLDQVRVDGCVLTGPATALEAVLLANALERYTPSCPKVFLDEPDSVPPEGWKAVRHDELLATLLRVFAAR